MKKHLLLANILLCYALLSCTKKQVPLIDQNLLMGKWIWTTQRVIVVKESTGEVIDGSSNPTPGGSYVNFINNKEVTMHTERPSITDTTMSYSLFGKKIVFDQETSWDVETLSLKNLSVKVKEIKSSDTVVNILFDFYKPE